jgi:hypothetical protein
LSPTGTRPAATAGLSIVVYRPSVDPRTWTVWSEASISAMVRGVPSPMLPRRIWSVVTRRTPGSSRITRSMSVESRAGLMATSLTSARSR